MSELSRRGYSGPEQRLSRRLGASLPNLDQPHADGHGAIHTGRLASLRKISPDAGEEGRADGGGHWGAWDGVGGRGLSVDGGIE